MPKIQKIYIGCSKRDFYFATLCISSIRYWNINLPIVLMIDYAWGDIDTTYLEKYWQVTRYESPYKIFKESYIKLEPLFENTGKRILTLDADIIFLGNIVEELEKIDSDFICQKIYPTADDAELNQWWFNLNRLHQWDSSYQYPGYVFYAGQLVTNDNIFTRKDFEDIIDFGNPPKLKQPAIFLNNADQGILNYVLQKKSGMITISNYEFFIGRYDLPALNTISFGDIRSGKSHPRMIHYYGPKNGLLVNLPAEKILRFYEKFFYQYYPNPTRKYFVARLRRMLNHPLLYGIELAKKIYKKVKQKIT